MNNFIDFLNENILILLVLVGATIIYIIYERQNKANGLSPQELAEKINHEKAVVVDIRTHENYKKYTIIFAKNIEASQSQNLSDLSKINYPVILICEFGQTAAQKAKELNKTSPTKNKFFFLQGGLQRWIQESMPIV